jgi:hypothetical protein
MCLILNTDTLRRYLKYVFEYMAGIVYFYLNTITQVLCKTKNGEPVYVSVNLEREKFGHEKCLQDRILFYMRANLNASLVIIFDAKTKKKANVLY